MKISEFAISRRVTVLMAVMVVIVLGVVSLSGTPIDMLPEINLPMAMVMTTYSGAGPQEIESLITKPLESSLATISNFESITSSSTNGASTITVSFTQNTDMDMAALDMREKIDMVKSALPADASDPTVFKLSTDMMPVMYIGVRNDSNDLVQLKQIVDDKLQPRLTRISGVAAASTMGGKERQILIEADAAKLQGYNLSIAQITNALRAENLTSPGGVMREGGMEYSIRVDAEYKTVEEIQNLSVATPKGTIRIADVAAVYDTYAETESYVMLYNAPCVMISIQKQSGVNTVQVSESINKELEKLKQEIPDLEIVKYFDQADYINKSIGSVANSALLGGILAILVLYLFLKNIRTTIIIGVSIPISIIATFVLMYFSNITLNLMSLGGLAVGVGMLVDNSIVVLESIFRYVHDGVDRTEAAKKGSAEVGMAVTASTLTTIAVFLPIAFVRDNLAITLFSEMALTVTYSLASSLVVSITLVPAMASKILAIEDGDHNFAQRLVTNGLNSITNGYKSLLWFCINHRKLTVLFALGTFVLSIVLVVFTGKMEFFPASDVGEFEISVEMARGTNLETTGDVTRQIVDIMIETAEKENMQYEYHYNMVGGATGFGQSADSSRAMLGAKILDIKHAKKSTNQLADMLRQEFAKIPGAKINVSVSSGGLSSGMSGGSPVSIEISGDDLDYLNLVSQKVAQEVAMVEGTRQVKDNRDSEVKEVLISINRSRAQMHNVSAASAANIVKNSVMGSSATKFRVGGTETDIMVRFNEADRKSLTDIESLVIMSNDGRPVKLIDVASVEKVDSPSSISRKDQVRRLTVTADTNGERAISEINKDIKSRLDQLALQPGYSISYGGEAENIQEAAQGFLMVILLAILLVYMVMAGQFESLIHPFVIMFTIPLAFIGVAAAMALFDAPYSVPALIGVVVLVGVVVNNGIVLIDYINQLRKEGQNMSQAIMNAGPVRLRPILMTTLTTVLGLVPMAMALGEGAESQQPMAVTIIGGLSFSTLLTLVFIPVLYSLMEQLTNAIKRKFRKLLRKADS